MCAFYGERFMKAALTIILAGLVVVPGLFADNLQWDSAGNNPVGNYYVSPYTATDTTTGAVLTLYCIDFNHEVAPPYNWVANINPLTESAVPLLQYGASGSQSTVWTEYETAAYLIEELTGTTDSHQQAIFQYAAWEIFLDSGHTAAFDNSVNAVGGTFAADISNALGAAESAVAGGWTPTGWEVVTPDPKGLPDSTQEFLVDAPVPEPSALVLLATVLAGLALVHWRRSGRKADAAVSARV
jgi:hypothetical protein